MYVWLEVIDVRQQMYVYGVQGSQTSTQTKTYLMS